MTAVGHDARTWRVARRQWESSGVRISALGAIGETDAQLCDSGASWRTVRLRCPSLKLKFPWFVGRKALLAQFLEIGAAELPIFPTQIRGSRSHECSVSLV
jgi:hypothetical protein